MLPITRVWHDDVHAAHVSPRRTPAPTESHHASGMAESRGGDRPDVSVVLVARAGDVELTRALEALANQTYPSQVMEVVVVCASAEPSTSRMVATLARRRPGLRLRFVTCPRQRGTGAARNCGWRRATGPIVGFTSDDVVPSPRWVEGALEAFDPIVDVVGGQVVVPLPARPSVPEQRAAERLQAPWTAHNVFYRRRLLLELDGFDEEYSTEGHDDIDLMLSAIAAGARFCAAEGAVVVHDHPAAGWWDELRRVALQADEARLYRRHPRLYAQYVRHAPPAAEYASLVALCGVVAGVALHRRTVVRSAAALWAGLTLTRTWRTAQGTATGPGGMLALLVVTSALAPMTVALRLYGAIKQRVLFF